MWSLITIESNWKLDTSKQTKKPGKSANIWKLSNIHLTTIYGSKKFQGKNEVIELNEHKEIIILNEVEGNKH